VDRQRPKERRSPLAQKDRKRRSRLRLCARERRRSARERRDARSVPPRPQAPVSKCLGGSARKSTHPPSPVKHGRQASDSIYQKRLSALNYAEPTRGYCFSASSGNRSTKPPISPEVRNSTASSLRNSAPILARASSQECTGIASTPAAYTRSIISLRLACSWVPAPWLAGSNMKTRSQPLNTSSYHSSLLRLRHENV
jgi:hypothetical protein